MHYLPPFFFFRFHQSNWTRHLGESEATTHLGASRSMDALYEGLQGGLDSDG